MRFLILAFVTLISICAQASESNRHLDLSSFAKKTQERLFQKIPNLRGTNWDQQDLDLLLQSLVVDENYDSAQIMEDDEQHFRVVVGKVRRISSLKFVGSSHFSESDLRRETGLSEKTPFDPSQLVEAGEKIRLLYEQAGYPKTQVTHVTDNASPSEINVTLQIQEGPQTRIKSVKFQTGNQELKSKLERWAKSILNEPLTEIVISNFRKMTREKLSEAKFWKTELLDPQISRNFDESEAQLVFEIKHSDQYFFETDGAIKISKSEIENLLGLDSFSSSNPNIAGELASKSRAYYLSRGFARAEVEGHEIDGAKPSTKRIQLKISEGPRIGIQKIQLSGNYSDKTEVYLDFLSNHSSEQIQDGYYVKDDFDLGLKNLITDRWNKGYLQAKIVSTRALYNSEKNKVTLLVQFEEGPLTTIDRVSFEGLHAYSPEELLGILKLQEGEPLRLSDLETAVLNLKDFYRNHGYLEMNLLNEKENLVIYNQDNTRGHLNFVIQEGPQVKVASILVEGNTLTKDFVIFKELEFNRGDILTPSKIEESTSRLQRLGFFSSVEIKTLEEKTNISERTVLVRVNDRDPGLFNLGVGVNNERGVTVRGYTGVAYRNIQGTGRGGSVRLEGNYNVDVIKFLEHKITLGYVEPYLFNSRVRGRLNVVRSTSVKNFDSRQASEVNQTTWSLEQDITSHLFVVWDFLSIATIHDFYIDKNGTDKTLDIGSTALTADLDYRNHPFNPSKGTLSRINFEYGSPFLKSTDTIEYFRTTGLFSHYQELFHRPNWVWANSIRGGYIKNLSKKEDGAVPYDKKGFILGGQGTIRGFTPDEAFPNRFDFNNADNYDLKTSATMTLFKSEIRFPIWSALGGAIFYDGGSVQINCQDNETTCQNVEVGWRDSFGLSLRYGTPFGAVSFEYGWKIKPRGYRNENPSAFHISIGTF